MEVQSLSVVIPAKCPNRCPFCVSHMNKANKFYKTKESLDDLFMEKLERRMNFARDNGCNTLMLTSTGEATSNLKYLSKIIHLNDKLERPFRWIELQTSGVNLEYFIEEDPWAFRQINTISLSIVDIFLSGNNSEIMKMKENPGIIKAGIELLINHLKSKDYKLGKLILSPLRA